MIKLHNIKDQKNLNQKRLETMDQKMEKRFESVAKTTGLSIKGRFLKALEENNLKLKSK